MNTLSIILKPLYKLFKICYSSCMLNPKHGSAMTIMIRERCGAAIEDANGAGVTTTVPPTRFLQLGSFDVKLLRATKLIVLTCVCMFFLTSAAEEYIHIKIPAYFLPQGLHSYNKIPAYARSEGCAPTTKFLHM